VRPVSAPRHCAAYLCTDNAPSPQRLADGTLECFFRDYTRLRRDVGPAGAAIPSLSVLCGHPRRCSATPRTATTSLMLLERTGTGCRHTCRCTSYGPPWTTPSSRPKDNGRRANRYTTTLEAAPVRAQDAPRRHDWNKIRQDGRQLPGTARHASTRRRIVQQPVNRSPLSL
jgi:hypothetical protein